MTDTNQSIDINAMFPEKSVMFFQFDDIRETINEVSDKGRIIDAIPDGCGAFTLLIYDLVPSMAQPGQTEKHLLSGYSSVREFRISHVGTVN